MKFHIPNPCSEDWNKMKIGLNQRHCDSCQKNVVDFTQRSREEILTYLLMHNGERVCGHIRKSQLDFSYNEIMFVINGMTQKEKKSNLPFYILCMGALLLTSCSSTNTTGQVAVSATSDSIEQFDSLLVQNRLKAKDSISPDTATEENIIKIGAVAPIPQPSLIKGLVLTGEVMERDIELVEPEEIIDGNMELEALPYPVKEEKEILAFVEVMPEFPGGMNQLMKFLRDNVNYPPIAKDNNIQGTVVAAFVVTDEGVIEDIRIARSVKGATYFDTEVIRVIKKMPKWTPGMQNGKPVNVRFHLPVKFRLE